MNSKRAIALLPEESSENSEHIVYAHDLSGNITFVNKEAELISGYSREEARRMNITQFIAPEFLAHVRERFSDRAEEELGTVEEIDIIAKDGRRVALEVSTRVISHNGRPVEIQGIAVPSVLRGNPESDLRPRCLDEAFSSQILLSDLKNLN